MMPLDFQQIYPAGTYERFLVETIGQMDLGGFSSETPDLGGETPYDPRALLGLIFYGFSTGTYSSRRLSAACIHDIRYVFVSGGCTPDHATICRFLVKYHEAIKELFTQILYIADNLGLIDYRTIAIDGTKIKGDASRQFTGSLDDFRCKRDRIDKKIERALAKQSETDDSEEREYWQAKTERYAKTRQRIDTFLAHAKERLNENGTERHQSGTDRDCRILKSHGEYLCGYNGQVGIDVESGLLVGAEVVDHSNDKQAFPVVVEVIRSTVPPTAEINKSKYLADNGYYSPDTMEYARKHGLDVYVSDRTTSELYETPENATAKISAKDCCVDVAADGSVSLICPGQERLVVYKKKKAGNRVIYRFSTGVHRPACLQCGLHNRCVGKNSCAEKEFEIDERAVLGNTFLQQHREKLHSESGKRIYSKRMSAVERVFGHIKGNGGFHSFLRRGLKLVDTEWKILTMCFNVRRMFVLTSGG